MQYEKQNSVVGGIDVHERDHCVGSMVSEVSGIYQLYRYIKLR